MDSRPLLSLQLSVSYPQKPGILRDLRLDVGEGEILALVGESGCGKSTLALAILRLLHLKRGIATGNVRFQDLELMLMQEREMRRLRGKDIALVLQSPLSSLNPALRIGTQLGEAWKAHRRGTRDQCREAILESLREVTLPADNDFLKRYPAQLSVGQAQRVLIAMAVMHHPSLLIADEPTSALDLITQAEILKLFAELSRKFRMGILYISHDMLSVATIAQRVAVMREGQIVESASTPEIFRAPKHAYTRQLIESLPAMPNFNAATARAGQ